MDIDTSINFQYISRHPLRVVAGEKQQSRSYIFREKRSQPREKAAAFM
jgi:hypothetical protein